MRDQLLKLARERMRKYPGRYVDHIYGEHENGGTSTLYISPISCDELCFPCVGTHSTAYSNRQVTHTTPTVAGAAVLALSGIFLAIKHFSDSGDADDEGAEEKKEDQS